MKRVIIIAITILIATGAYAGEANLGMMSPVEDIISYHADASVSGEDYSAGLEWDYGKTQGVTSLDRGYIRLGYDPVLSEKWSLWLYGQSGYNHMRDIDSESFVGFGPKYTLVDDGTLKASLSVGLIAHVLDGDGLGRLSVRPKARYGNERLSVDVVAFYQPNLKDADDYILTGNMVVGYNINKAMSIKLMLKDEYRSLAIGKKNELTKMLTVGIKF